MTTQRTWLWMMGVIGVAAVALALGTPLETLLIIALLLACPLGMYFMMGGMGRQRKSGPTEMERPARVPDPRRTPHEQERQAAHSKYEGRPGK